MCKPMNFWLPIVKEILFVPAKRIAHARRTMSEDCFCNERVIHSLLTVHRVFGPNTFAARIETEKKHLSPSWKSPSGSAGLRSGYRGLFSNMEESSCRREGRLTLPLPLTPPIRRADRSNVGLGWKGRPAMESIPVRVGRRACFDHQDTLGDLVKLLCLHLLFANLPGAQKGNCHDEQRNVRKVSKMWSGASHY